MNDDELMTLALDCAFLVHRDFGPGLLESVYELLMEKRLRDQGLDVVRQYPIAIRVDGMDIDEGFRADLLVENRLLLELKSVQKLIPVHGKQLLTYLKVSGLRRGLLVNFNEAFLKNGIRRVVNGYDKEGHFVQSIEPCPQTGLFQNSGEADSMPRPQDFEPVSHGGTAGTASSNAE